MGSITVRKRKDGSAAYTAKNRIMQKGVTVYQESQTFDRKAAVQAWIKKREVTRIRWDAIDEARQAVLIGEMKKTTESMVRRVVA